MKLAIKILFLFVLVNLSVFGFQVTEDKVPFESVIVDGDIWYKVTSDEPWKKVKVGQQFKEFFALRTGSQSYLQILLQDNSVIHVGEKSALTLKYNQNFQFNLERGKLRILSVKNLKVIETPWGKSELKTGEFLWDVHEVDKKLRVEITSLSGSMILDGESITPESYDQPPEKKPFSAYSYDYPYLLYFGENEESSSKNYKYDFNPKFPERSLASAEDIQVIIEEKGAREFVDDAPQFDPVKGEIWVHDIVYDEAVRIIEKKSAVIARQLMPAALRTASENLVGEVASRSVLKWGVKYAKNITDYQVPIAVQGSYLGNRNPASTYYEKDLYRESTERIAEVRSYRAAKVAVLKKGYEKGWQEAQKYALTLLPKVITPLVSQEIYESVKDEALSVIKKVIKKSELVHTKDVERLVDHLAQITAKKECERWIDQWGPLYTQLAAQSAAKQAARDSAEEIAFFMANESKKRAGNLMGQLLARERARKVAREVAQEAKEKKAESYKKRSRRYFIESQR